LVALYLWRKECAAIPPLLEKIQNTPREYGLLAQAPFTIRLRLRTYNIGLEFYRDQGRWKEGLVHAQEAAQYLDAQNHRVPDDYRLLLYYQFAYLYFMDQHHKQALFWLNEIFSARFGLIREDIQSYAHLLYLMIHFDLGHISILKYAVDGCRRFLKKKRSPYPFEKVLLSFFSKVSTVSPDRYPALLEKLKAELFFNTAKEKVPQVLDYLDFMTWIKSRAQAFKKGVQPLE